MDGTDNLLEQGAGVRLFQPPPRPHVGVQVRGAGGEDQVGSGCSHYHFTHGVDVRVAVHSIVGGEKALTARIVEDGLKWKKR